MPDPGAALRWAMEVLIAAALLGMLMATLINTGIRIRWAAAVHGLFVRLVLHCCCLACGARRVAWRRGLARSVSWRPCSWLLRWRWGC